MFGLLDRLSGKKRRAERARRKEMAGDLQAAAELYLKAELPAEAARVLLLSADAVADPERRIVICAQAARVGEGTEVGQQARRRKALLSYDLAVSAPGATMHGELLTVAGELEACDEWEKAAQAYSLAGDEEAELRVLREAGAIERLESRLHEEAESRRFERDRRQLLRKITDLDSFAERREALRLADQWLETHTDEQVQHELVKIRGRLLSGPLLTLQVEGSTQRFALGSEVTLGRSGATITVHSRAVSRQHLRLFRQTPLIPKISLWKFEPELGGMKPHCLPQNFFVCIQNFLKTKVGS